MNAHALANPHAPIILSDKRERFIRHIIQGLSQREAYLKVWPGCQPASADTCASRMLSSVKVQARMAQIREAEAAAAKVDLPYLTGLLQAAYRLGVDTKQSSAATQAAMGIAKLHGFLIERHQLDHIVRRPATSPDSPDEMSEQKWLADYGPLIEGSALPAEPYTQGSTYEDLFGEVEPQQSAPSIDLDDDSIAQAQSPNGADSID